MLMQCPGFLARSVKTVEPLSLQAPNQTTLSTPVLEERSNSEFRTLQLKDPQIGFILKAKETGKRPTSARAKGKGDPFGSDQWTSR